MAKQPTVTVNVNAQQFQQFVRNFNQFSGNIKALNQQFNQINTSLQKTNALMRGVQATMQGLLSITKSVGSEVWKITKQFISWGTIVGGVTALLGFGGGLFGIDRLAASIMQKRRMAMGLGMDYGRAQAAMTFSRGVMSGPEGVLSNIKMGMSGDQDKLTGLLALGINPFGKDSKLDPDQVMDKLVEKLPEILNRAGPGKELMMAKAFGLDKFFTDPLDMLRLATKEGQEEYKMKKQLTEQYKDQMKITPKALRAWTELSLQFSAAKAQIESVFGETLADLSDPLKDLSQSFAHLVRVFLETPEVQRFIKWLSEQIKALADKIKKLQKEDIEEFIKKIKNWLPTMDQFKSAMHDFVEILQGAVNLLSWLKDYGRVAGGAAAGAVAGAAIGSVVPGVGTAAGAVAGGIAGAVTPKINDYLHPTAPTPNTPAPTPAPNAPNAPAPAPNAPAPAPAPRAGFGAGASPFNAFGGSTLQTAPGASKFSWFNSIPGMGPGGLPSPGGGGSLLDKGKEMLKKGMGYPIGGGPSATPAPSGGADAARKFTPPAGAGGGGFFGNLPSILGGQGTRAPTGPLSMDNWQSTRTASLVVRNVPGANIFMSATGMTG